MVGRVDLEKIARNDDERDLVVQIQQTRGREGSMYRPFELVGPQLPLS